MALRLCLYFVAYILVQSNQNPMIGVWQVLLILNLEWGIQDKMAGNYCFTQGTNYHTTCVVT